MKLNKGIKFLFLTLIIISLANCGGKNRGTSNLTGWKFSDYDGGAGANYKGQTTPLGMVLIEGGAFTMGHVQDDVMFDWNTTPVKMQVRSFYIDEAEVTNREYRLFLQWMEQTYPPNNDNYRNIYTSVLPDTLVWRNTLGDAELLTETYLRHPSYNQYPVVGVSWVQAVEYCKWRTNMVNEKILMDKGILNPLHEIDSLKIEGKNRFDTDVYLSDPNLLFDGDSTIYKRGLPDLKAKSKGSRGRGSRGSRSRGSRGSKGGFTGRHVKVADGILTQKFRLPSEVEWEFAAKALVENREYNTLQGRKKFSWNGKYTRSKSKRTKGDQQANFKYGKGNYSGLPGWSDDGADITNAIKSYKPNALGLYDMTGNVAEWVSDVYRPIVDNDANDFNYYRGNSYEKKLIDENGKVVVVDYNSVQYDTLDNGTIKAKFLPGSLKYIPITKSDAFMRDNYEKSYNVDSKDGDIQSTKKFYIDEEELETKPRMYNSPKIPREIGESGYRRQEYDKKIRTTLISDKTRVYKGGSWKDRSYWLDPSQRRYLPQYMATNYIGFRCATDRLGPMTNTKRKAYHK
ncbi:MAG: gliding motility lipoprotein GldJ [Flavobacteriaceae bacterium]|nr:gliding motility lipoprotein GldJ [Flavobacteriaceae bacterium]